MTGLWQAALSTLALRPLQAVATAGVATGVVAVAVPWRVATEVALTLRALRVIVHRLAVAVEEGLLEDIRTGLDEMSRTVALMEQMTRQMDQALPVLDATAPALGMVNGTLSQLTATVAQVEGLPGVRIARRFVGRPGEVSA